MICSFLRGSAVRDVEAVLQETFEEPVIGKSTVARAGWAGAVEGGKGAVGSLLGFPLVARPSTMRTARSARRL